MTHRMPAEWAPQQQLWIGFPGDPAEWPIERLAAQEQAAAFASAVAEHGETTVLLVRTDVDQSTARTLVGPQVDIVIEPFGDIWLRDTGPISVAAGDGHRALALFDFNGWGRKYCMPGDEEIGERLAAATGFKSRHCPMVFEGGATDTDGTGLFVTTEQCLLNANRNPGLDRRQIETLLGGALGLSNMLWLGDGLANDHTDGHVDNLARFVGQGLLAIPEATLEDDPNTTIFADAAARARAFGLTVASVPSVGRFKIDGDIVPASYMNFCVTNGAVIVPQFGAPNDKAALDAFGDYFPDRAIVGLACNALLRGGGGFHCMSQQLIA